MEFANAGVEISPALLLLLGLMVGILSGFFGVGGVLLGEAVHLFDSRVHLVYPVALLIGYSGPTG